MPEPETRSRFFLRLLLFAAVASLMAAFVTMTRSRETAPRLISVRPLDKRTEMPGFTWVSTAGHKWSLEEQRGKVVFVNFWATWCGPCRQETPDLVRVYSRYRGRGVTFAGVSMDDEPGEVVPDFADHYGVEYPILIPSPESALAGGIQSIPTSFLLDRQGRVARAWVGIVHEEELVKNIEELLSEAKRTTDAASGS